MKDFTLTNGEYRERCGGSADPVYSSNSLEDILSIAWKQILGDRDFKKMYDNY